MFFFFHILKFGHIFKTPETALEISLNLQSQAHLQTQCCCYLALERCKYISNICPFPPSNRSWCSQAFFTHFLINPLTCVWQLWQFSLFYLPNFWCWPKLLYLKGKQLLWSSTGNSTFLHKELLKFTKITFQTETESRSL